MIEVVASSTVQLWYLFCGFVLAFLTGWAGWVWWQVSGVRGAMLMVLFASLAVVCLSLSILHANDPRIPVIWVLAVSRGAWAPAVVSALVWCDLYYADHNGHFSYTTRSYTWYKRVTGSDAGKRTINRQEARQI